MQTRRNKNLIFFTVLLISVFSVLPHISYSASLSVAPVTSRTTVGNVVSVRVLVSTQGKSINNAESTIIFPKDLVDIISVNKNASIFSLWVEEPKFSNIDGKLTFNGGVPNPGYIGDGGEIVTINLRTKKAGTASIVFTESAVRENNGLGTDILSTTQPGVIVIDAAALPTTSPYPTLASELPAKPIVTSTTNPDQNAWYSNKTSSFNWTVPSGVTSIQTLLSKSAVSTPTVAYDNSVSQRTILDMEDGISYFHIRYVNSQGAGPIARHKVQIDTVSPEKFTTVVKNQGVYDVVGLNAVDKLSGVDSYSIKIDGNQAVKILASDLTSKEYNLPTQNPGDHELVVVAYDKAGNHTESSTIYTSGEILSPEISINPANLTVGDPLKVSGKSEYSNTDVEIYIENTKGAKDTYKAKTNDSGEYETTLNNLTRNGDFKVYSKLIFSDLVKSDNSNVVNLKVSDTSFVRTTKTVTFTLLALITLVTLFIALLVISYLGWHKFFGLKKKLNRDFNATINDIHKTLMMFKEELSDQLKVLEATKEDRVLNKKEEKIFKELQNNIDDIDNMIEKKLKKLK